MTFLSHFRRKLRSFCLLGLALLALYLLGSGPAWALAINHRAIQSVVLAIYGPIFDWRTPYIIARPTALYIAWWRRIIPAEPVTIE